MDQGRDGVRHEGKGEDSVFWWGGSEPSPVPPLVEKHPEECAWSDYCYNFEKIEREYFPSKQQIYSM